MTTTLTPAAQKKFDAELSGYHTTFGVYRREFVVALRHEDDERHIVVDERTSKIVKRFKDGELSWNKAERFADDYYWEHRFDEDESPLRGTLRRSGLAPTN